MWLRRDPLPLEDPSMSAVQATVDASDEQIVSRPMNEKHENHDKGVGASIVAVRGGAIDGLYYACISLLKPNNH